MSKKNTLLSAAAIGLCVGAGSVSMVSEAAPKKKPATIQCYGISKEAGENGCAISKAEIATANSVFKDKYVKSKSVDCAGLAECATKKGILSWKSKATKEECFKEDGFLMTREGEKYTIEDKSGIKKPS